MIGAFQNSEMDKQLELQVSSSLRWQAFTARLQLQNRKSIENTQSLPKHYIALVISVEHSDITKALNW